MVGNFVDPGVDKPKVAKVIRAADYNEKRKAKRDADAVEKWAKAGATEKPGKYKRLGAALKLQGKRIESGVERIETGVQDVKDNQIKMENLVTDGITRLLEDQNARFGPVPDASVKKTPDQEVGAMKELYAQAGTELQRAKNKKAAYIEQQRERIAKEKKAKKDGEELSEAAPADIAADLQQKVAAKQKVADDKTEGLGRQKAEGCGRGCRS